MKNTFDRVHDLLVRQLGLYPDMVTLSSDVIDDLGADSLDQIEIIMALEEEFGVEIDDEDALKFRTARDLVNYLDSRHL